MRKNIKKLNYWQSPYSGFLSTLPGLPIEIKDMDKNGFMAMCHELNVEDVLDLISHTPVEMLQLANP